MFPINGWHYALRHNGTRPTRDDFAQHVVKLEIHEVIIHDEDREHFRTNFHYT